MKKIIIILSTLILSQSCMKSKITKNEISFTLRFAPTSLDPMKFDRLENQIVTSSVNATLVSNLSSKGITPSLAKSWSNLNDFKSWTLEVDTAKKYSDGSNITVADVYLNIKRYVFLNKIKKSKNDFLDNLVGYKDLDENKLRKISEIKIDGLKLDNNKITFEFTKAIPNFLDKISFGLYAIAHPSSFNDNGEWNEGLSHISTGEYKVESWEKSEVIISKTKKSLNGINRVKFLIGFTEENLKKSEMAYASKNSLAFESNWKFLSRIKDTNIVYIKVMKWDVSGSYWANKKNRQSFRDTYYKFLESEGLELSKSYFPTHIKGVKKIDYQKNDIEIKLKKITIPPFFNSLKSTANFKNKDLGETYKHALEKLCVGNGVELKYADYPENEKMENEIFDFQFLGTGINAENPYDDIRFMFLSSEGIKIPFISKTLEKELMKDEFDVQKINEILNEEAIVWPIIITSQGFWVNELSGYDFSSINLTKVAIDFSFIGN